MMKWAMATVALCLLGAFASAEPGFIRVDNGGGYVAKFTVEYKLDGEKITNESGQFTLGVSKTIKIPEKATNVFLKVELYWFIGSTSDVFQETFPGPVNRCYKIWGTTLSPSHKQVDCDN